MEASIVNEGVKIMFPENLVDKPTCSRDINDGSASDSTQIGLIDEEEARKIDKVIWSYN
jgi:hypothetical protein